MARRTASKQRIRPITIRRSKLVQDILSRPQQMRYGAIPITELATRHSGPEGKAKRAAIPQWEVERTLKHVVHYLSTEPTTKRKPIGTRKSKHEYYTESKREREEKLIGNKRDKANYLRTAALVHEHMKFMKPGEKKKAIKAANEYLSSLMNDVYSAKRRKRVESLVDYLYPRITRKATRHALIHEFLGQMSGTARNPEMADRLYETVKKDLYALSYASLPLPDGTETKPSDVVDSHRADFVKMRDAIDRGYISRAKAAKVSKWFTEHAPALDLERIRKKYPTMDLETREHQEKWAEEISNYAETLRDIKNWHPARAYGRAWQFGGLKLHLELPIIADRARELYDRGGRVDKITAEAMKVEAFRQIWAENIHRVRATHFYDGAWAHLNNIVREYGDLMDPRETELYQKALGNAGTFPETAEVLIARKKLIGKVGRMQSRYKNERENEMHHKLSLVGANMAMAENHRSKARKLRAANKLAG